MPILDVEIVTGEPLDTAVAAELADAAGQVFASPPAGPWVRVRPLPSHLYSENAVRTPDGPRPVFVTVLKAQRPTGAALDDEVRALTEAVARICRRAPEEVHVLYEPDGAGRIAFGGRVRR